MLRLCRRRDGWLMTTRVRLLLQCDRRIVRRFFVAAARFFVFAAGTAGHTQRFTRLRLASLVIYSYWREDLLFRK